MQVNTLKLIFFCHLHVKLCVQNSLGMAKATTKYTFKNNDARTFVSLLHCHPGKLKLWLGLKI